jgi:hypothetical protein
MPYLRETFATGTPASPSMRIATIWLCMNLLFLIGLVLSAWTAYSVFSYLPGRGAYGWHCAPASWQSSAACVLACRRLASVTRSSGCSCLYLVDFFTPYRVIKVLHFILESALRIAHLDAVRAKLTPTSTPTTPRLYQEATRSMTRKGSIHSTKERK